MAIGNKQPTSGLAVGAEALTTGTKNGTISVANREDARENTAAVFSRIYETRQNTGTAKLDKQQRHENLNALLSGVRQGDPAATASALSQLDPTISAALNSMVGGDTRYKTRARLMALDALKNYDPAHGTEITTHVYNRLMGLKRLSADRGNFIHVPEKSALEKRQLEEIKKDYMLENGSEPSLATLADLSGMNIRKVGRLMSIYGTTSTSATRGESGDSLEHKPRTAIELYNDAFYEDLPEIDKKIYEWSTGYMGAPQLDRTTMARRLGISEAAISQHAKRIDQRAANFNRSLTSTIYGD